MTAWAFGYLDLARAERILDVGCGGGMAIGMIAQIAVDGFVAGLDHSGAMVRQAIRRNRSLVKAGRVVIERGDVASLPYQKESFDRVIAIETFPFWPDPFSALEELRRVLKPGGTVALVMEASMESPERRKLAESAASLGVRLYSGAELVDLLTGAGFSRARFESAPGKGRGWLCALGVK